MMDPKPQPNRERYLDVLRRMTPEARLKKAFEPSELGKRMLKQAVRTRYPDASEEEVHRLFLEQLKRCHNRNY